MPLSMTEVARRAKEQLAQLTGLETGTVTSLSHSEDGWHVVADVVELKRIPNSNDILATYAMTLDEKGNLTSYERTRRYSRNQLFDKENE